MQKSNFYNHLNVEAQPELFLDITEPMKKTVKYYQNTDHINEYLRAITKHLTETSTNWSKSERALLTNIKVLMLLLPDTYFKGLNHGLERIIKTVNKTGDSTSLTSSHSPRYMYTFFAMLCGHYEIGLLSRMSIHLLSKFGSDKMLNKNVFGLTIAANHYVSRDPLAEYLCKNAKFNLNSKHTSNDWIKLLIRFANTAACDSEPQDTGLCQPKVYQKALPYKLLAIAAQQGLKIK